ncbi:MAG TPA: hypothetical protein VGJ18_04650 [Gemmatimonadaceae bacterium]
MAARREKTKRERRSRLTTFRSGTPAVAPRPSTMSAIGIEAEFVVVMDGAPVRPEVVFGSPRRIVRGPLMHRTGRSYHLPTGSAVYFDTGVIELATPMIEIDRGCAARAGRSLWESILFLRRELDHWQERNGREVRLVGFSTHYNVSFDIPASDANPSRTVEKLALLLTYLLPAPVMLLAANRQSTGIGVRPRGNRVEVTADFTPDAALMIATATLVVGIVREVMTWPTYELSALDAQQQLPRFRHFAPAPHSSRKGWVARYSCFPRNPFTSHVDDDRWETQRGESISLREIAGLVTKHFWPAIRRYADPFTLRLIGNVMAGRAPSLLELADRPPAYESVGTLCAWEASLFPEHELPRSRYERVLIRAIHGDRLRLDGGETYTPTGMRGWSHVIFRRERDRSKHVFSLDYLLRHLEDWEARSR